MKKTNFFYLIALAVMGLFVFSSCELESTGQALDTEGVDSEKSISLKPIVAVNGSISSNTSVSWGTTVRLKDAANTSYRYFVSIQLSDSSWNRYGTEAMEWVSSSYSQQIADGTFDLKAFCSRKNFTVKSGSYYRVKIATDLSGIGWQDDSTLMYVNPLSPRINNKTASPIQIAYNESIILWDYNKTDTNYFVSVQRSSGSWSSVGPEAMEWVPSYYNSQIQNGTFDVRAFCWRKGLSLYAGFYYRVKLAIDNGQWESVTRLIYIY